MLYFSIQKDNEIVKAGGFFCRACSVGKPIKEESKDHKGYCNFCSGILEKENYFSRKNIKEEKQVKKVEAEEFIQGKQGYTIENHDGHYSVITPEGKKITKAGNFPQPQETSPVPTIAPPKKKGRSTFPVKDLKTGQVYPGMEAAKVANKIHIKLFDVKLENGQARFVKA